MPIALAPVSVALLGIGARDLQAKTPAFELLPVDTVPNPRSRLVGRPLFSPDYVKRALAARLPRLRKLPIDPHPLGEEVETAAEFGRRYSISVDLAMIILETAREEGIDPELGFRMIRVESVFKPNARGSSGSLGLTQLMPSTARSVDRSLRTEAQILEPKNNLRVGFRYLRRMIERYDGNVRLGLLAYNRGEGAVDRALRKGRDPENGYSELVLGVKADAAPGVKGKNRYRGEGLITPDK